VNHLGKGLTVEREVETLRGHLAKAFQYLTGLDYLRKALDGLEGDY
jgi:hypothetical protein